MENGRFGIHGGQYVPEAIVNALNEFACAYDRCTRDPEFNSELEYLFNQYTGRPSRLYFAENMTRDLGGAKIFIAPLEGDSVVNPPPPHPHQGLDHFGLTVKDIDAVAAEIKAKGVTFTREPTTIRPGIRICFIRGPEGISVELLERDKKYT